MVPSKPSRVVGIVAAISSAPLVVLAGLGVSSQIAVYLLFVVTAIAFIGVLAMLLFVLALMLTGISRLGFCIAGVLCALGTCIVFTTLYALLGTLMGRGPWLAGALLYTVFSLRSYGLWVIAVGLLGGWIASAKRFAL